MTSIRILLASCVLALAGCASSPGTGNTGLNTQAAQTVFALKSGYDVALTGAVGYKRLPTCSATVPLPCSDAGVVAQIQRADNVTAVALNAAESAVRTPQVGATAIERAVGAAQAALVAFTSILSTVGASK